MSLLRKIKCLLGKHEKWVFDESNNPLVFLVQSRSIGNGTLSVEICKHCSKIYGSFGQLTQEQLDHEAKTAEAMQAEFFQQIAKAKASITTKDDLN